MRRSKDPGEAASADCGMTSYVVVLRGKNAGCVGIIPARLGNVPQGQMKLCVKFLSRKYPFDSGVYDISNLREATDVEVASSGY
jgi:hypothetical protein